MFFREPRAKPAIHPIGLLARIDFSASLDLAVVRGTGRLGYNQTSSVGHFGDLGREASVLFGCWSLQVNCDLLSSPLWQISLASSVWGIEDWFYWVPASPQSFFFSWVLSLSGICWATDASWCLDR